MAKKPNPFAAKAGKAAPPFGAKKGAPPAKAGPMPFKKGGRAKGC